MERLTGVPSQHYKPKKITLEQLALFEQKGYAMTASTVSDRKLFDALNIPNRPDWDSLFTSKKLRADHEYYVLAVNQERGTITLGNPWGWGQQYKVTLTFDEFQRAFQRLSVNSLGK